MADEKRRPVRAEKKKIEPKDEENSAGGDDDDAFRAAFKWWAINNPDPSLGRSRHPLVVGVVVKNADPERTCKVDLRYCGKAAGGSSRDVLVVDDDGRRKKIRGIASNVFGDPSAKSSTHLSVPTGSIAAPVSRRDSATQSFPRTDVARTSDKIFASVHGQWETLELATTLARHLAGDAETAEPRMEQFFCSETEGCRDAKLSNDAIAATIAQLVALGICDRGYRQIAKIAHSLIADSLFRAAIGTTEFGLLESMLVHIDHEKNAMSFRAPFFLCDGRADAYVYDRSREDFCCLSDGRRISSAGASLQNSQNLHAVLQATRRCAKHRNGVPHKESVVFAMPLEYGFARDSFPCLACRGSAQQNSEPPKCPLTMPVALCIRNADENPARSLVTASDIKMVACLVATRRYDEMVCDGCVETDAACVATLCASENLKWRTVSEAIAANAARAVEAKIKAISASASAAESISRAVEREAAEAARVVSLGEAAVESKYGLWVEDAFCDERTFAAAAAFRRLLDISKPEGNRRIVDALRKKFGTAADADLGRKLGALARGGNFTAGGANAAQNLQKQQLLPGEAELSAADWDLYALRPWVPPCIARILDACNVDRHPSYHERTLVGSFMCRIDGLAARFDHFYAAWCSMFQHPEKSFELYGNPGRLDSSKYGHAAAEDAVNCAGRGISRGCPHAIKNGLCPFALGDIEETHGVLRRIEQRRSEISRLPNFTAEAVERTLKNVLETELPKNVGAADRCKTLCARYLAAASNRQNVRIVMVSSPAWFYKIARTLNPPKI